MSFLLSVSACGLHYASLLFFFALSSRLQRGRLHQRPADLDAARRALRFLLWHSSLWFGLPLLFEGVLGTSSCAPALGLQLALLALALRCVPLPAGAPDPMAQRVRWWFGGLALIGALGAVGIEAELASGLLGGTVQQRSLIQGGALIGASHALAICSYVLFLFPLRGRIVRP